MAKYKAWLATYASVKVHLETDEEYDLADPKALKKLRQRFADEGQIQDGLCHRCSSWVEIDDDFTGSNNKDFPITLASED